jgi:serine/threonine protein kinase
MASVTTDSNSWGFSEGDEVVPHCTYQAALGGGVHFEAYQAVDDRLFAPVVVKIVRPNLVERESVLRDLSREVELTSRLRHPLVVRCFHFETAGPRPYLALEKLPGRQLATILQAQGTLDLSDLLRVGMGLASVLHYLRIQEVVHLDLTPANVIVGRVARLIDFNLARDSATAASTTVAFGTRRYMAPEQCDPQRAGRPGPASDVWGLGGTLYKAICGKHPFRVGSASEDAPITEQYPQLFEPPRNLPSHVPDDLRRVVMACLAKDPDERPLPADVFFALQSLTGDPPAYAPPHGGEKEPTTKPRQSADHEHDRARFRAALRAKQAHRTPRPR